MSAGYRAVMNTGEHTATANAFRAWPAVEEAINLLNGSKRYYLVLAGGTWLLTRAVTALAVLLLPYYAGDDSRVRAAGSAMRTSLSFSFDMFPAATVEGGLLPLVLVALVSAPFAGAFAAFGLRRAAGLHLDYGFVFRYARFFAAFLTLELLSFAIAWLTFSTVPLLLLAIAAAGSVVAPFVPLFMVDREMGPIQAVVAAANLVAGNLGQSVLLLLISIAAGLATSLTFGIAGLWLLPLLAIAYGRAFQHAVGIHTAGEALPLHIRRDSNQAMT